MDTSPNVVTDTNPQALAETVRAKRLDIDNDLEVIRVRLQRMDPRRRVDARRIARFALPIVAGTSALLWARRRPAVDSLEQLFIHLLGELYQTERDLMPALAVMAGKASDPDLRAAFEEHQLETEAHVERLERVFQSIGSRPKARGASVVPMITAEGARLLGRRADPDVRDAWLIATAQRIEHQEIAGYGTARAYAETLAHLAAVNLLQETLEEERMADEKLTRLATRFVNSRAR
jgi:ferritin-like metal-binding protein YciE